MSKEIRYTVISDYMPKTKLVVKSITRETCAIETKTKTKSTGKDAWLNTTYKRKRQNHAVLASSYQPGGPSPSQPWHNIPASLFSVLLPSPSASRLFLTGIRENFGIKDACRWLIDINIILFSTEAKRKFCSTLTSLLLSPPRISVTHFGSSGVPLDDPPSYDTRPAKEVGLFYQITSRGLRWTAFQADENTGLKLLRPNSNWALLYRSHVVPHNRKIWRNKIMHQVDKVGQSGTVPGWAKNIGVRWLRASVKQINLILINDMDSAT